MDTPGPAPVVCLVERDPDLLPVLGDLLADRGFRVAAYAAPDADIDLDLICPAVVVLDVTGGRDGDDAAGIAFLREVTARHGAPRVPVVVSLGGWFLTAARRAEVARLADAVLAKPFDIARFLATVADCARSRPATRTGRPDGELPRGD